MNSSLYPKQPIYVVDDEEAVLSGSELVLEAAGLSNVICLKDGRELMPKFEKIPGSVVLLDLSMPHLSGEQLLPLLQARYPRLPVIVVTGHNEVDTAIRCMKAGAFDYLVKPVDEARLTSAVAHAIELSDLRSEYSAFKQRVLAGNLDHPEAFAAMVAGSPQMTALFQYVETIAPTNRTVLITGETGVGKELMAKAVHLASGRDGPFVAVNVAGLDDNVFSDTLFGHLKGAFTGAEARRGGLVEQAAQGTLFLDEIGDLVPTSQVKLLRLLQEGEYYPLGADAAKISSARVVVATNQDLAALQQSKQFRSDLYYRLQTHHVPIPPLRERRDDLLALLEHFLQKASSELGKKTPSYPKELLLLLAVHSFRGNVRELESMVFEAVSRHTDRMLSMGVFKQYIQEDAVTVATGAGTGQEASASMPSVAFGKTLPQLQELQRILLDEALVRAGGNQTIAAKMVGLSRSGLSKALARQRKDEK